MSWTKHFTSSKTINSMASTPTPKDANQVMKYSSYLPELYAGHPNRIQRYYQYSDMLRDSDISAAVDTIADFCTQSEEQQEEPFLIKYIGKPTETETKLLDEYIKKWIKVNNFRSRIWTIFKNTIAYGDQFFIRDPETKEWLWLDHFTVESISVDNSKGKIPKKYIVRGLSYDFKGQLASQPFNPGNQRSQYGTNVINRSNPVATNPNFSLTGQNRDLRNVPNGPNNELIAIDAEHIIHLSLTSGMDVNYPFGQSILEPVFKTYKQKELLEDSIIIYRVQRAPERRIFYIDVGTMPPLLAQAEVERVKNAIHQRRIPNRTGGGSSLLDAAYNPLSIAEDYFFAQTAEGRGSKVETLPGGDNLGEIGDLTFFTDKLARGLRIPPQYLNLGSADGGTGMAFSDGKLGQAVIQEFRFNKYCTQLQTLLSPSFDRDFKKYLEDNGVVIDETLYELQFNPPQNFTKYRQIELDTAQIQVYQAVQDNKKLSERFKFKRFLNLTEAEILENEAMWKEENAKRLKSVTGSDGSEENSAGLDDLGIRDSEGFENFSAGSTPEPEVSPETSPEPQPDVNNAPVPPPDNPTPEQ